MIAPPPPAALPDPIAAWIRREGGPQAVLLITVDGWARPHVAMLARDEIFVISAARVRVAIAEKSRTAENIRLRTSASLAIFDADLACTVKTRAAGGERPLLEGTVAFDLVVEDVRLDSPAPNEASARLVTGLRFEGRAERRDIHEKLAALDR